MKHQQHKPQMSGSTVYVGEGQFESAFRKFRKKIEASGLLRDIQERQAYTKPTTRRKKARAAAKKRWQREQAKQQIPKRNY